MDSGWPLIGRHEQLAALVTAAHRGRPGGLIHGAAGVGKTRFAYETVAALRDQGVSTVLADDLDLSGPPAGAAAAFVVATAAGRGPLPPEAGTFTPVTLDPLTRPETDLLVRTVLAGPVAAACLDWIWQVTRGNCGLLREIIRAGRELGTLHLADGVWHWAERPPALTRLAETARRQDIDVPEQQRALEYLTRPLMAPRPDGGVPRLTSREQTVLEFLAEGLTAESIGRRLGISARTVCKHRENLYRKLGSGDRLSTVLRGHSLGLVPFLAVRPSGR